MPNVISLEQCLRLRSAGHHRQRYSAVQLRCPWGMRGDTHGPRPPFDGRHRGAVHHKLLGGCIVGGFSLQALKIRPWESRRVGRRWARAGVCWASSVWVSLELPGTSQCGVGHTPTPVCSRHVSPFTGGLCGDTWPAHDSGWWLTFPVGRTCATTSSYGMFV